MQVRWNCISLMIHSDFSFIYGLNSEISGVARPINEIGVMQRKREVVLEIAFENLCSINMLPFHSLGSMGETGAQKRT